MKPRTSTVSIIIPTRHRAAALGKCLESVSAQTARARIREVIVVDDGPSKETEACVGRFHRGKKLPGSAVIYLRQEALGANAARNRAIRLAKSDIVCLLDDDAVAQEGWLEALLRGLEKSGKEVAAGAIRLPFKGPILGKHREEVQSLFAELLKPAVYFDRVIPVTCNMAAYRAVFNRALFDETVRPPVEEVDWLLRADATSTFVEDAWVWHEKAATEVRWTAAMKLAWRRGSEGGWWFRTRRHLSTRERLRMIQGSLRMILAGVGHAGLRRCSGGLLTAAGEAGRALALAGIVNRGPRKARSWR